MKKILLLLVGAIVAFATHAQLYVCGDNISWTPESPKEVTLSDGWYTFQVSGGFKMSRTKGGWNDFNGNSLDFDSSNWTDKGQIKENTLTASTSDTGNKTAPDGYSYLRVSKDFSKIQASKDGKFDTSVVTNKDFWLIGKFNGWSQKDEAYHFETTDGKTYTYTAVNEIKSNPGGDGDAGWKINEGTWDNGYEVFGKVAGTSIEYNTVFNLTTSRDAANLEKDIPAGAKMTLTYNPGGIST